MADNNYLKLVEDVYLALDAAFDTLYAEASSKQRLMLRAVHASARDAYWKAVAERLEDDNPMVKQVVADLKKTTKELKSQLSAMEDVAEAISVASKAVQLAGSLVTLAGT